MPSMAKREPLGLWRTSRVGAPERSTYWVATWPFLARARAVSSGQTNRPSPWDTATVYTSSGAIRLNQGLLALATRVRTSIDWCRPMTL